MIEFTKIDDEQHLIGGIVYSVSKVDSDGDAVETAADLWNGIESFALNGMQIKLSHEQDTDDVVVVESFQSENDQTMKAGRSIPAGSWWLTVKVLSEQIWDKVRSGELGGGFSMGGKATAQAVEG